MDTLQQYTHKEIISVDVETTGPVPGLYAMIELGAVSLSDGDEFHVSIKPTPSKFEPGTAEFWSRHDKLLAEILEEAIPAKAAMCLFREWLKRHENPRLACWPASFDFPFVSHYWWRYVGTPPPFGFSAIDIGSIASTLLGKPASKLTLKRHFPECFDESLKHTHRAVEDAREQAFLLKGLLKRAKDLRDFRTNVSCALSMSGPDDGSLEIGQITWILEQLDKYRPARFGQTINLKVPDGYRVLDDE